MILLTDYVSQPDVEHNILKEQLTTFTDEPVDKEKVRVLLIWHFHVTDDVLEEYPNLVAVVRYGVGVDNVDLQACQQRGIKVFNNPDYGVDEVSDTAVAMMMALGRNIIAYNDIARQLVRKPNEKLPWQENTNPIAKRLSQCTLGIVGAGRIGSAVLRKMSGIVNDVVFYDPFVPAGYEKALRARRFHHLEELLATADIVSVHVPLSDATEGMINYSFIANMKEGSMLINTARGGLIGDLVCIGEALTSGHLSAVGLDVLPQEPPINDESNIFFREWLNDNSDLQGRLIVNPHTSYYSPQAYQEMRENAAKIALNASKDVQQLNRII